MSNEQIFRISFIAAKYSGVSVWMIRDRLGLLSTGRWPLQIGG